MRRLRYILYALAAVTTFGMVGCSTNDDLSNGDIQYNLVGRAVTFDPSLESIVSRTNHDGFNSGDVINIYPSTYGTNSYNPETNWVQYKLTQTLDAAGNVIKRYWTVNTSALKYHSTANQTLADSISWENTNAVRFRAWGKSSIDNYNDYLYADYASVAGPTQSVPLVFKHLGCRIGFTPKAGNSIVKINICTNTKYYTDDSATGGLTAAQKVANVQAAWNKVCMPDGIQMYANCDNNGYSWGTTTEITEARQPQYGTLMVKPASGTTLVRGRQYQTSAEVTANTSRPTWRSIDGIFYAIVCPYEMANETFGNPITLPAYTRFEVYIYDVNNGDAAKTSSYEGDCHTFALSDVKSNGTAVYPDGMTLQSNYSYMFSVGYYYNQLTVTPSDSFAWTSLDAGTLNGTNNQATAEDADYKWWQDAMSNAAETAYNASATGATGISPVFNITNVKEWKGFVNIVNGNLPEGGLHYTLYTPQNGNTSKAIDRDNTYLTSAFNFEGYTVNISNDIDFMDESIASVGTETNPFKGSLNGGYHAINNGNFAGGYLFGYVNGLYTENRQSNGSVIGYLKINGTKNTTVIQDADHATLKAIYMTGPSANALALKSVWSSYVGCAHIGTGSSNGPLVGETNSVNNRIISCFIAATGNGYIGGGTNNYYTDPDTRCYYDKTLTPSYTGTGSNTASNVFTYYDVRGVISAVLKARYDYKNPTTKPTTYFDTYYGGAPWKIMNGGLTSQTFHFEVPTRYTDQYPVLVSGKPNSDQYIYDTSDYR